MGMEARGKVRDELVIEDGVHNYLEK